MLKIQEYDSKYAKQIENIIKNNLYKINIKDYGKDSIDEIAKKFTEEKIKEEFPKRLKVFIALENDEVVGTASIDKFNDDTTNTKFIILTVFVKIENQHQGIGKKLIERIEKEAISQGAKEVVIPASIYGCEFYRKLGYDYIDKQKKLNDENLYMLVKNFNQTKGWSKYYKAKTQQPSIIIKKFFELNLDKEINEKIAIDLGCGSGNDTIFLLEKGFSITSVDAEQEVVDIIKSRTDTNEKINFIIEKFGNVKLPKTNLVVANLSIPFCPPKYFKKFTNEFTNCINKNGYFVGNFFGKEDGWREHENKTFVDEEQLKEIFKNFDIIYFKEKKYSEPVIVSGRMKFWHIYEVIARKR